jgi:hypothetical protein
MGVASILFLCCVVRALDYLPSSDVAQSQMELEKILVSLFHASIYFFYWQHWPSTNVHPVAVSSTPISNDGGSF